MKSSLLLTLAILVIGTIPGIYQHRHAAGLKEDQDRLLAEAATLGLAVEADAGSAAVRTKRQREDQERRAVTIAGDVAAVTREIDAIEASGGKTDDELQQRAMEAMSQLMELDAAQIRKVIGELRADAGISDETRDNLIAVSILSLTEDHPETALALYTESSGIAAKNLLGDHLLSTALSRWAEMNPAAALDWIRRSAAAHPDMVDEEARKSVLAGTATRDPVLAFKLSRELGIEDSMGAVNAIMMAGTESPEKRTAVFNALREHLSGIEDPEEREETASAALEVLARGTDKESYESLTGWMDSVKLNPAEKTQFAAGLTWFTTKGETGKWVEWIAGNLPGDRAADPVRELVGEWTQQDYVAAGQWLSQTPDGSAKAAAVEAYAGAVAEYEPQVAVQWAMTLPPGPARLSTLRVVHQNWPASDPQGAAAFAREHGLE
jgi:hypothetical protein